MNEQIKNVLVVEDNEDDLFLVKRCLSSFNDDGYRIETKTAITADVAITHCLRNIFDAIILDLNLPDMQGEKLFRRVKSVAPKSAIIILTGISSNEEANLYLKLGAFDFLLKGKDSCCELHWTLGVAFMLGADAGIGRKDLENLEADMKKLNSSLGELTKHYSHIWNPNYSGATCPIG